MTARDFLKAHIETLKKAGKPPTKISVNSEMWNDLNRETDFEGRIDQVPIDCDPDVEDGVFLTEIYQPWRPRST